MANSLSEEFISSIPKEKGWMTKYLYQYEGFWYNPRVIEPTMNVQNHFKARSTDIIMISIPKSGTTWLKAILFAIMNRSRYEISSHPLLTSNPHTCVPFLEFGLFRKPPFSDVDNIPSPRLFSSHMSFHSLPDSVTSSGCKIIYIFRDPKDVFISMWHFFSKLRDKELPPLSLDEAFELFCQGKHESGPFWDHLRGYKQASLKWPERVFFITYDEMKSDPVTSVKRLAEFVGCPFSTEEDNNGVVKDIIELCSFDKLKNLEVNKLGSAVKEGVVNDVYFRKGEAGDWKNHLTTQMAERLDKIAKEKLDGIFP